MGACELRSRPQLMVRTQAIGLARWGVPEVDVRVLGLIMLLRPSIVSAVRQRRSSGTTTQTRVDYGALTEKPARHVARTAQGPNSPSGYVSGTGGPARRNSVVA